MKYTVLLMRPDYVADRFGEDTYLAFVTARSPTLAIKAARLEVLRADDIAAVNREDYHPLFTLNGWHNDITPGKFR